MIPVDHKYCIDFDSKFVSYNRNSRRSLRQVKEEKDLEKDNVDEEPAATVEFSDQNKKKKSGFRGFIDKIFTKKLSSTKSSPASLHSKTNLFKNQSNPKIQEDFKSI